MPIPAQCWISRPVSQHHVLRRHRYCGWKMTNCVHTSTCKSTSLHLCWEGILPFLKQVYYVLMVQESIHQADQWCDEWSSKLLMQFQKFITSFLLSWFVGYKAFQERLHVSCVYVRHCWLHWHWQWWCDYWRINTFLLLFHTPNTIAFQLEAFASHSFPAYSATGSVSWHLHPMPDKCNRQHGVRGNFYELSWLLLHSLIVLGAWKELCSHHRNIWESLALGPI